MDDTELLHNIQLLVDEEHRLMQQHTSEGNLNEDEQARLHAVEVSLDQ